jgi:predicted nucleic acid-binding protein
LRGSAPGGRYPPRALDLAERYRLSLYDALICAAAQNANAAVRYTEDLQDGLALGGLRVCNPFAG